MQAPTKLYSEKHAQYIRDKDKSTEDFEYWVTEHLRMSGYYWGLTALDLLRSPPTDKEKENFISWILSCQQEDGGFGGAKEHDSHLLYTLSAIQVLGLFGALSRLNSEAVVKYVISRQLPDGSFTGDEWGEVDTRFSCINRYIALSCLSLLHRLDAVDVKKAVSYIVSCKNFDGGFGCRPGAESHAGQVFCCVGTLAIAGALSEVNADLLGWWLCERQCKNGGLNGRPEKEADVCYSWWVLSALKILDRLDWIDKEKLQEFILACQDEENGGISDKPGNVPDVFHTFFGVAGLSLLGYAGLEAVDPTYALPERTLKELNIPSWKPATPNTNK